jgi:hypothetical protein
VVERGALSSNPSTVKKRKTSGSPDALGEMKPNDVSGFLLPHGSEGPKATPTRPVFLFPPAST